MPRYLRDAMQWLIHQHLCRIEFSFQTVKDSGSCLLSTDPQRQDYMDGDSEKNLEFHLSIFKISSPQSLENRESEGVTTLSPSVLISLNPIIISNRFCIN